VTPFPGSRRRAGWPAVSIFVAAALLGALYLSWRSLAAVDFLYPWLYDAAGIGAHIDEFAPQNRYRKDFEATTRDERLRLFAEIARAIRHGGRGLERIRYRDAEGTTLGILLRPPERVHLQDVAHLVGGLETAGLMALAVLCFQLVYLRRRRRALPSAGRMLALTGLGIAVTAGGVLVLGPRDVFYRLHEWVFPPDHQWFFYYQDSLMSTLMKAPYLFGYIAVALVALAVVYLALLFALSARATRRTAHAGR
jgi:hypothetical protein